MATSKIQYLGELRCVSTHIFSNTEIFTDAPLDNHGKAQSFSPTDLLATSLANCMLTVLGIYAQNNNIKIENSRAEVTKIMSQDTPRRVIEIKVDLTIVLDKNYNKKVLQVLENVLKTCPVAKSLHPDILQNIKIDFIVNS